MHHIQTQGILVTGGLGYLGSHLALDLILKKLPTFIIDLDTPHNRKIAKQLELVSPSHCKPVIIFADLNTFDFNLLLKTYSIETIYHFAGKKSVVESWEMADYYKQFNGYNIIKIVEAGHQQLKKVITMSTSFLYDGFDEPLTENDPINFTNPYAESKFIQEENLKILANKYAHIEFSSVRCFNPIGANIDYGLYENFNGSTMISPCIMRAMTKEVPQFKVFGNQYHTPDGTPVKDYIHILDFVELCYRIMEYKSKENYLVWNTGSGQGTSILQLINLFEKAAKAKLPYIIDEARRGDKPFTAASLDKVWKELNWQPKYTIEQSVQSAYDSYILYLQNRENTI